MTITFPSTGGSPPLGSSAQIWLVGLSLLLSLVGRARGGWLVTVPQWLGTCQFGGSPAA